MTIEAKTGRGTRPDGPRAVPRVLQVVGAMNVGGAETMLMNLYRNIDRSRIQFDFMVMTDEPGAFDDEIIDLGGRIISSPGYRWVPHTLNFPGIRNAIESHGPYAAVHSHILHASGLILLAAAWARVPVRIAHSHSTDDPGSSIASRLYKAASRRLIAEAGTEFVACGVEAGDYLFRKPATRSRVRLLRNGIDLERFAAPTQQCALTCAANSGFASLAWPWERWLASRMLRTTRSCLMCWQPAATKASLRS